MPRREDIESILIIGAGPIVIGQACEFDYSGTQAIKALKREGYRIVLVNSNPATVMTDPNLADATYIEPLRAEVLEKIIARERPDALLTTMGGQTGLNLAVELDENGVLEAYGVKVIGAGIAAIRRGEDREEFRRVCRAAGLEVPAAEVVRTIEKGLNVARRFGFPVILRPAYTLGGTGGGVAHNEEELRSMLTLGLMASPVHEVLVEESVIGWKEFELEVMRDKDDNCVVICSIENLDPMGVHTGDSVTVAPALTLSDSAYQRMRDAAFAVLRGVGVETGGSNVQFAFDPKTERILLIEMNPRVSRSSALASKATGFPIAKIAALLAVGYRLDEIENEITGRTKAAFEPVQDYVVTKIPRFAFEKFKEADQTLTTSMKSVGEVMAIGRNFRESLQKALRGLEIKRLGLGADGRGLEPKVKSLLEIPRDHPERRAFEDEIRYKLTTPNCDRLFAIKYALMLGITPEEIEELSRIDRFFIAQIERIVDCEKRLCEEREGLKPELLSEAFRSGFIPEQIAYLTGRDSEDVRRKMEEAGLRRVFKCVDTCAGEFESETPYYYGTYGDENELESNKEGRERVVMLGSGPNRIGQGIEFDCCLCHATAALREEGFEVVMVNSNPETVSTDYDTSDLLVFDPVVAEDVVGVWQRAKPKCAIVTLGGQTPLSIAREIEQRGVVLAGTSVEAIHRAEDRESFAALLERVGLRQPPNATVTGLEAALEAAEKIGYPVLVRPSYVLGGRAMMIAYHEKEMERYAREAIEASDGHPLLIDRFLADAIEADVDAVSDGRKVVVAGTMEHVEPAGVHSGDSAATFPAYSLPPAAVEEMEEATRRLAKEIGVVGLINVQFAWKDGELYVLEANPRASRTVPFLEKATGVMWAGVAARVMLGRSLQELGVRDGSSRGRIYVKEVVLPFHRFGNVDPILGPEMKSTGEVMGVGRTFGEAYLKAQWGAGHGLTSEGGVLLSITDAEKDRAVGVARRLEKLGMKILATAGTARRFRGAGIKCTVVGKISEGSREILEGVSRGEIRTIINVRTPGRDAADARRIDCLAVEKNIPVYTTMRAAEAVCEALEFLAEEEEPQPYRIGV
ncbi:MAG: carbamoyl-phosphate synthase large subunit [Candidatus Hydrogenedentota bacterium]|nr:MAG: carbamoyl-phosphate synthase large subunit [Candidatus Hydrogenedentota bacterium]